MIILLEEEFQQLSGSVIYAYDQNTLTYFSNENFKTDFNQFFDGEKGFFFPYFIGPRDENISVMETLIPHKEKNIVLKFDIESAEYDV